MFAFFDGLVEFISTVINFVINFFSGLVHFFLMVGQSMAYLVACIGYMPAFLTAFVLCIVGLSIILQIVNHGG